MRHDSLPWPRLTPFGPRRAIREETESFMNDSEYEAPDAEPVDAATADVPVAPADDAALQTWWRGRVVAERHQAGAAMRSALNVARGLAGSGQPWTSDAKRTLDTGTVPPSFRDWIMRHDAPSDFNKPPDDDCDDDGGNDGDELVAAPEDSATPRDR